MHGVVSRPQLGNERIRGFTLIELMTVVIMITIFAAISIPLMTKQLKERRAANAAEQVATLYRNSRLRAMGRGSAVLVRYTPGTRGRFDVREAQRGSTAESGCEALPVSSCLLPDWNGPEDEDYRPLSSLDLADRSEYGGVTIDMLDRSDSAVTNLDICFTPMGRTFYRTNLAQPLVPLTETHVAEVFRGEGTTRLGRTRRVIILPNGTARIE
jgi:type IV fimbrial biogenesis protein FimT